jgi:predicted dehydrogenase
VGGKPVTWGLIGTTGWAGDAFAPAVLRGGGILVAGAGSTPEKSKAFAARFGLERSYRTVEELLADDHIEAVWIASPNHLHFRHAMLALDAGKHVLLEKPMATSVSEAQQLATRALQEQCTTAVGYMHRFNPAHRHIRQLLQDQTVGPVCLVRLHHFAPSTELPSAWRQSLQLSGGGWVVNDVGTHLVDLMQFLLGRVELIGAQLDTPYFHLPTDDIAVLLLRCGETIGIVDVSSGAPGGPSRIEFYGTLEFGTLIDSWGGGGRLCMGQTSVEFPVEDIYARQVHAFNQAVRGNTWEGATWADGLAAVQVIEQALAFAARGRGGK